MKLTFTDSYKHIWMNQVLIFVKENKGLRWFVFFFSLLIGVLYFPVIINVHIGLISSTLLLRLVYYLWFAWFYKKNGTLCPKCSLPIIGIMCSHCNFNLPPIIMLFKGAFLNKCPNCQKKLSISTDILAFCEQKHGSIQADSFLTKPTWNIVYIVQEFPEISSLPDGFKVLKNEPFLHIFYERSNDHTSSSSIYFIKAADWKGEASLDDQIRHNTFLLLIGKGIDETLANQIQNIFLSHTSVKII